MTNPKVAHHARKLTGGPVAAELPIRLTGTLMVLGMLAIPRTAAADDSVTFVKGRVTLSPSSEVLTGQVEVAIPVPAGTTTIPFGSFLTDSPTVSAI